MSLHISTLKEICKSNEIFFLIFVIKKILCQKWLFDLNTAIKHNFPNALQSNMNYAHKELIRFYAKILSKLFSTECDAQKTEMKKKIKLSCYGYGRIDTDRGDNCRLISNECN